MMVDLVPTHLTFQAVSRRLHAGGSGTICYHLNKEIKESGVLVDGRFYRGFPNPQGGKGNYVVLFPVPQEGPAEFRVELVARPSWGSEVKQTLSLHDRPHPWRHDNLKLSDNFLRQVAANFPGSNPSDPLGSYLEVNRNLRRQNHETFMKVCSRSDPQPLGIGAMERFRGKRMARFGDRRTYLYQGKEVDHQTHMGEDLASLVHSPVPAGNNGVVVFAGPLGIYGQTVILDHGLGLFSSYSHLSKIDVKTGDKVAKGTPVGLTGATGLAAGDHLHFAVLLQGQFVDPLEWWDPHWVKDQVTKIWVQALAPAPAAPAPAQAAPAKKKAARGKKKSAQGRKQRH
jgi:murein DD-endopeptidase MepM/ murein hydrolase activator NlpD